MQAKDKGYKEVNNIQLYYEIYGEGEPVVLIHGGGSSGFFDFEETIKRLHHHFMLVVPDLQNHGRSGHRSIPETFDQDAKDVVELLNQLGIAKASFLGFSNGATTTLHIAHSFPEKTNHIIVASGVCKRSGLFEGFFEMMNEATIDMMPAYLKQNFQDLNPDPLLLQNMFQKDNQRMVNFEDIDDAFLASINAPALIIGGDKDVMKVDHLAAIAAAIPGARLMVLPTGHGTYLMPDENGHADFELIDFTTNQIEQFLTGKYNTKRHE